MVAVADAARGRAVPLRDAAVAVVAVVVARVVAAAVARAAADAVARVAAADVTAVKVALVTERADAKADAAMVATKVEASSSRT